MRDTTALRPRAGIPRLSAHSPSKPPLPFILEPVDEWSDEFLAVLGAWDEDIPRPEADPLPGRDPFE